ncbi:MAG: hypothetical protein IJT79_06900 [Ruminococcus sp.]|nr:hypothetical protein [Ruminococcus sp.]
MFKKEKAETFTKLTLRIMGMRCTEEYEVVCGGESCQAARYLIMYARPEGDRRELQKSAECSSDVVLDLLNKCNVIKWDGFSGANPRGVRDGWMINFEAEINGKRIHAGGSNNFPKHYSEFREGIHSLIYDRGENNV